MPSASRELAEFARRLAADGYVAGRDGNLSARTPEGILITASNVPKEKLTEGDVTPITDTRRRSSEWAVHDAIYRARPEVAAVIHAHPLYATVLAVRGEALEPLLDEVAPVLGGRVEVAAYAPSGGDQLARNVVAALGERHAVLLARHGSVTTGATLEEAFYRLQVLERAALVQVLR